MNHIIKKFCEDFNYDKFSIYLIKKRLPYQKPIIIIDKNKFFNFSAGLLSFIEKRFNKVYSKKSVAWRVMNRPVKRIYKQDKEELSNLIKNISSNSNFFIFYGFEYKEISELKLLNLSFEFIRFSTSISWNFSTKDSKYTKKEMLGLFLFLTHKDGDKFHTFQYYILDDNKILII